MPEIIVITRSQLREAMNNYADGISHDAVWSRLETATAGQPRTGPEFMAEAMRLLNTPGVPILAVQRALVWATLAHAAAYALTAAPTMPVHDAFAWANLIMTPCPHGDGHTDVEQMFEQDGQHHDH
jgi:hypothetical protein